MENNKESKSNILLNNVSKILKDVNVVSSNEINEKKNVIINKQEKNMNNEKNEHNKSDYDL